MINLLPTEEKKKIALEYHFRLASFYMYVIGTCLLLATVVLLPAYFLVSVKESFASNKLEDLNNMPVPKPDQETLNVIQDLNMKINLIESSEKNRFSVSEKVVDEIIARKMSDIKILQIDYEKGIDGARIVKITGMAPDRERLLLFRQTLESDQNFSNVDLPISNFVKGKNINFELKITVK